MAAGSSQASVSSLLNEASSCWQPATRTDSFKYRSTAKIRKSRGQRIFERAPWRLAIVWDKTNPKHSSTKPVRWQGESNHGLHLWKEPDPVQNKFTLFKNSGKEFFQYKNTPWEILIQNVSPSGKRKVIAVGSLDLSDYIKEELASQDVTVTLKPVKKSVLSGSLQFILSSTMLKDGFPCQSDKEILDNFMKDTMELRRQSLQKASKSQEDSSKSNSQEASGSKATLADTVPALQCDAGTKASGPLEAASCSTNNSSGKRKVKRKPVRPHPSRPAPPPPPRGVSQSTPPAARPPRPPPPSKSKGDVKDVKHSLKHNEEKASKDGSSSRSAHPRKGRSGMKAKQKYPKELNPFGSDTPLLSSEKTSKCEFPPELNPFSEEYNDDQGSSSKGGTSEMATSPSNGISSDGTHFILVESSPSGKRAPMQEDEHTPNTTMPEASTSSEDTSIHMKPVDSSPSGKEVEVQQKEHAPNTSKPAASSSNGDTSISVKPVYSSLSGKEAAVQQEEHAPNTSKPEASTSSGDTSIHVKPVDSSSSGKEAAVQQEEHAPNTSKPEASTSSGEEHTSNTTKSPQELSPFSEGFNDEHGSSSEGDTISSDVKQCDDAHAKTTFLQEERGEVQDVKGEKCNTADRVASTACKTTSPPAVARSNTPEEGVFVQGNQHENEAASLIILHCPELFSSIDEEVCVLQEEIVSLEKVSINLELEMQAAMQKKDCEEELRGLSQDWIGVTKYRTELIRRKQDLDTLTTEKNLEECINRLRQELMYSLELEGWRKSEKNKVRDRLLLDCLVSFVTKRDFVSRMD